jgi:hypothetical protein
VIAQSTRSPLTITWEPLPQDFVLPNDPVDNINQPALAAVLTEALELANRLPPNALTPTNYGICATVNGKTIVKAPDWAYIPQIRCDRQDLITSYTPNLQGDPLTIAIEFISETDGGEYSMNPRYPYGKLYFYEQILAVPLYAIFEPHSGDLELYYLNEKGKYQRQITNDRGHYDIPQLDLTLAAWQGTRENRTGYWLRWRDTAGNLLPLRSEIIATERERSDRLAAKLKELGIDPSLI